MKRKDLMTQAEHDAIELAGEAYNAILALIEPGAGRRQYRDALAFHINAIEDMVLAQAAARAFPTRYRRLGE